MKELGKIDQSLLEYFVQAKCGYQRKEVSVGPGLGIDVSIIDLPAGMALAVSSDPLSLIPSLGLEESAWLSVQLMANDMATTGFAPMYGQFVLNLPSTFSRQDFKTYWDYVDTFCSDIGIAITGGHTGFIEGQNSTIAGGGTLFTIAPKLQMLTSQKAMPGEALLVTKKCALSSSSILALSFPEKVKRHLGTETYREACSEFYNISSLKDALVAKGNPTDPDAITAMHDVTEGGVLGAVYELVHASDRGAVIYNDQIPIGETQQAICTLFSIDPRYCIGAGSMILTCKKEKVNEVINRLDQENIPCCTIGEIKEKTYGIKLVEHNKESDLKYLEKDPYWEAFFKAYHEEQ